MGAGPHGHGPLGHGPLLLEVEIPSDVACIEDVVAQVVRCCEDAAFPDRHVAFHIPVALTEALSNAILRGNAEDATKSVRLRATVDQHALVVEVEDDGLGFDLEACTSDPTTTENLDREDGRGLFLMRRLMDQVEQFRGSGNVVRMILHRRSSDDRAA
ncbi:MAG: ATP-binding protein [Gemmatimonadaceae bacterium]|nr:ATP-binding protein [Gemmatimonadaceae bacterium]